MLQGTLDDDNHYERTLDNNDHYEQTLDDTGQAMMSLTSHALFLPPTMPIMHDPDDQESSFTRRRRPCHPFLSGLPIALHSSSSSITDLFLRVREENDDRHNWRGDTMQMDNLLPQRGLFLVSFSL